MVNDFLDMDKEAKELVFSLKKLNDEVKGYKNSKEQLSDLTKTLSGFIDETKRLTKLSSKVIENTAKLTPSKIDEKVDEISKRIDTFEDLVNKTIERVERTESSLSNQIGLLIQAVELNREAINNKKFSIFG